VKTITLKIPDNIKIKELDLFMIIASKLYEDGILSSGQAAKMVGLSKKTFIELLGKYGVSVFSSSLSELKSDIENA
jgi:predicted HTH domain antitoxin